MRPSPAWEETRLPRYLTSFIGREQEIAEITALLCRDDVRLLTLLGPGGAGKTRLAVEVMNRLDEEAWDGLWFIPLVAIRDPALVLPAIAQALGLHQVTGRPVGETITHFLRDRRALLCIDNLELVTEAAPDLARILVACPGTTMFVTSRIALRISGEHLRVLDPLPIPALGRVQANQLRNNESVQLFLARANTSGRELVLNEDNARDVADICRRLDGLPLALELAAARSGLLSPAALLTLLRQGSTLLSDGPLDAPERHRSMRDAIAWSYDLLTEQEQAVFRRLAVFSGGFSLRAVKDIVNPLSMDILATITSLAAKSLIVPVEAVDEEPRFTMLETLREFAQERLEESGEATETRHRHAAWFLTIAEDSDFAWCMPLEDGLARIHRLHREQGNVRAALAWLRRSGNVATCLHLASQLGTFWVVLGNSSEGQRWLEELLADPSLDDSILRAKGLAILSWIANQHGQDMRAFELAEEGLSIYRKHDIAIGIIQCLVLSGVGASRLEHLADTGMARHQEAIHRMKSLSEPPWIANWITGEQLQVAQISLLNGDLEAAETLLREAWDHLSGDGARYLYGNGLLLWTAHLARARGDQISALQYYQQTLELARRGFHVKGCVASIAGIAGALAALDQLLIAARLLGAAESLHQAYDIPFEAETLDVQRALGLPEPWASGDHPVGVAHRLRDVLAAQRAKPMPTVRDQAMLDRAWDEGRTLSLDEAATEALAAIAEAPTPGAPDPAQALTRRETDVLRLIAEGRSNRAIAATLCLSERTVEHHVTHILSKLDLDSRTSAAAFAIRNGLI